MKYVFGPVPSRRLGQSLGIDPIPFKTCNWNCVYCQLGRTRPLKNIRREFFPCADILDEVNQSLASLAPGDIDWVTFVGSGETTLHSDIGWLIQQVKSMTNLPVAVITNGSLLYLPEVRLELLNADAVLPSLDAGNPTLYRRINRPHPTISFKRLVDGLREFRKEYHGKLWIEVMLVKGVNDTEVALLDIAGLFKDIRPDEVHILQPDRSPVEIWVHPADGEGLSRAQSIFGNVARVILPTKGSFDLGGSGSFEQAIIGIVTRHPMREEELVEALTSISPTEITEILHRLEKSGKVQIVERLGVRFWCASPAFYPLEK